MTDLTFFLLCIAAFIIIGLAWSAYQKRKTAAEWAADPLNPDGHSFDPVAYAEHLRKGKEAMALLKKSKQ